jgi:AcrR family transcriptional regulator
MIASGRRARSNETFLTERVSEHLRQGKMSTSTTDAALATFEPDGFSRVDGGLQERRSIETRIAILEAAITCLAEYGYAKTTTLLVASTARASRGAMLHHYPTRQALIESTIEYAFYKRMKSFIASVNALDEHERVEDNRGLHMELHNFESKEYKAYLELHIAARTDKELQEIFLPRARQYDLIWREEVRRAFPEWQKSGLMFDRICEMTRSVLEGLLLNRDIWDDAAGEAEVVEIVSSILIRIRKGTLKLPATNFGKRYSKS